MQTERRASAIAALPAPLPIKPSTPGRTDGENISHMTGGTTMLLEVKVKKR